MLRAIILDDDDASREALAELVEREGFAVTRASTIAEARTKLSAELPDIALIDISLPDGSGLDFLKDLAEHSTSDIVLITGNATVDTAVEALRLGATDYLTKPLDVLRLTTILTNVSRTRELKREISTLRTALLELGRFGPLIGVSPPMQEVYDLLTRAAPTDVPVLVTGESGTGKEQVANAIHALSQRRDRAFVPVNCGAISPSLIESEIFGHEKGSFTGAVRQHKGFFEQAGGGTLFLDEITEMPTELQVKLLRALETGAVMRIGGEQPVKVDVRVIAATNRRPEEAVESGKLREDLFYRLNVFRLPLPPLRERGSDIVLLADYFLGQLNKTEKTNKRFSPAAVELLRAHPWPGNVRELKNVVQRAYIVAEEEIAPQAFPPEIVSGQPPATNGLFIPVGSPLAEADRRLILATLERCGGEKKKAASILGISLKTLYNRLAAYAGKAVDSGTAKRTSPMAAGQQTASQQTASRPQASRAAAGRR